MKVLSKVFIYAACLLGPVTAASEPRCLDGLGQALVAGNFSGLIVCSKSDATIRLVGELMAGRYRIYDYRYQYLPEHGAVMHGGQRVLIFRSGKYRGQYFLPSESYVTLSNDKKSIVIRPSYGKNRGIFLIHFNPNPPDEVLIDGEVISFFQ